MSPHIPEPDWRRFKEVRAKLLERFCAGVIDEIATVSQSTEGSAHERYLKVYKLIEERDKQLANAFDEFRRSTAVMQLGIMRQHEAAHGRRVGAIFGADTNPDQRYRLPLTSIEV